MSGPFAVDPRHPAPEQPRPVRRASWPLLWLPGLAVALGSAVATAHGLFEVAAAANVPDGIAWIYPLITDGLALVAYTATARLHGSAARYAWSVVVVAAGLSGLAQAVYLASDSAGPPGPDGAPVVLTVDPALRFGVGAWPAIAAAIVAHLLYLLAVEGQAASPSVVQPSTVQASAVVDEPVPDVEPVAGTAPRASIAAGPAPVQPSRPAAPSGPAALARAGDSPVRDRARAVAARHAAHHGDLPTVRELMNLAEVSRGTAATALKQLREQPTALHLVPDTTPTSHQA